ASSEQLGSGEARGGAAQIVTPGLERESVRVVHVARSAICCRDARDQLLLLVDVLERGAPNREPVDVFWHAVDDVRRPGDSERRGAPRPERPSRPHVTLKRPRGDVVDARSGHRPLRHVRPRAIAARARLDVDGEAAAQGDHVQSHVGDLTQGPDVHGRPAPGRIDGRALEQHNGERVGHGAGQAASPSSEKVSEGLSEPPTSHFARTNRSIAKIPRTTSGVVTDGSLSWSKAPASYQVTPSWLVSIVTSSVGLEPALAVTVRARRTVARSPSSSSVPVASASPRRASGARTMSSVSAHLRSCRWYPM